MKRFVTMCALAVALLGTTSQKASAWSKFNFGAGFNIGWESANTNCLWGAYKSGPAPYENAGYPGAYGGFGAGFGGVGGGFAGYGEAAAPLPVNGASPIVPSNNIVPAPAAPTVPVPVDPKHGTDTTPHVYNPYGPASGFVPASYFYPAPNYYWPGR
jgi:hypothetical protein